METADGTFSASLDMASMMHPQTLLCYQMNGRSLSPGHGAPLRLATPRKYGYKQIKQVAKLTYTNVRPVDFWEGLGYDWYAGL
jgi:DMSO/TMAO reductase YedYZ molybdopterin-dependent catalytic subunit